MADYEYQQQANPERLQVECEAVLPGKILGISSGDTTLVHTTIDLDPADKALLNTTLAAHVVETLYEAQQRRIAEVDAKTDEMVAGGFPFDDGNGSQVYSLGLPAQSRMEGVYQLKDNVAFTWPLEWSSKDDTYVVSFANAVEFEAFHLTAAGYLRSYIQSAYPVRAAIMAAASVAEVDAVVDPR
jgi:hypothetical protein